jgi:hypothetical protein
MAHPKRAVIPAALISLIIVVLFAARDSSGCLIPDTSERPTRSHIWKVERLQDKTHRLQHQVRLPLTRITRDIRLVYPNKRAGKLAYWRRQVARIRRYHATVPEYPWGVLSECESNRRWPYDGNSGFDGGIQFHPGTWSSFKLAGYPRFAWQASPRMQVLVGVRVLASQGWRAWPACSRALGFR